MSHEAAFHDGYRKALEEVMRLLDSLGFDLDEDERLATLREEIGERMQRARQMSGSSLAADASGKAGY